MPLCHCSLRHTPALWSAAPTNALISTFSCQAYMWKPCKNTDSEIHCGEAKVVDPSFCHRLKYNNVQCIPLDLCWHFSWENSDSFEGFYFLLNHQEYLIIIPLFVIQTIHYFGFHSIMSLFYITARIQHGHCTICFSFPLHFVQKINYCTLS